MTRHHHRHYSSNSSDNSSRSVSPRHHRHHSSSSGGLAGVVNSFSAPSFTKWVLIPTFILTLIFYAIGFPIAYNYTHGPDRAMATVYDKSCENNEDKTNCPSHQEPVSPTTAYIITAIILPIIAFALCIFVYKIVIFIRNPKVAAGYFLVQGLRK